MSNKNWKDHFVCVTNWIERARPGQHIERRGWSTHQRNEDRTESIPSTSSPPLPPSPETWKTISPSSSSSCTQRQCLKPKAADTSIMCLLQKIAQVEESSVVLRVNVQRSPVINLSLLSLMSQSAQIIQSTGMSRVQSTQRQRTFLGFTLPIKELIQY